MFYIVEFEELSCEIVPYSWVIKTNETSICSWPPCPLFKVTKLVKNLVEPEDNWSKFSVRVLATAPTYAKAVHKRAKCLRTSDIGTTDTEVETNRKRIQRRISSSEDSDDGNIKGNRYYYC